MNIVDKNIVYDGYFKMNSLSIESLSKEKLKREQLVSDDAVAALKQFRVGSEDYTIEIPAGKMDIVGESPEDTLKREVLEEIGYKVDKINSSRGNCEFYPTPGMSTEKIYLFYAEVSNKIEEGGGIESEEIEIIEIPRKILYDKFSEGYFRDGKTIMAIQNWLMYYAPEYLI
jgi:ADP-ribose pyrophosphatase